MLRRSRQADACRRGITRHPGFVENSGATIAGGRGFPREEEFGEVRLAGARAAGHEDARLASCLPGASNS